MEYWDVGDLAYFIRKKKGEYFTEDEIMHWFIQISMALDYIHGRKVLHRDIKASNIFLTGNNTVKLGDFGISRVLENTWDAAQTVVGTPYYMSPEVCESKPYTFKSDVWSLGWVLYELCTLQRAFTADNLLGLVYKIVQDKYEPIPDHYSDDLKEIINALLVKDYEKRPLVSDLLMTPFVNKKMNEFIENGGYIGDKKLHVRKFKSPVKKQITKDIEDEEFKIEKSKSLPQEDTEAETMTPKERMKLKKQRIAEEKAKELTNHAREAIDNYSNAKKRLHDEYNITSYQNGKNAAAHKTMKEDIGEHDIKATPSKYYRTDKYSNNIVIGDPKAVMISNYWDEDKPTYKTKATKDKFESSDKFEDSFAANDRWEGTVKAVPKKQFDSDDENDGTFMANDRDGTVVAASRFDYSKNSFSKGADTFKLSESGGSEISQLSFADSKSATIKPAFQKAVSYDDRKIVSSGKYDLDEYYYNYEAYQSDEFESDNENEATPSAKVEAEKDEKELTVILDNYRKYVNNEKQEDEEIDSDFIKHQEKLVEDNKKLEDIPIHETARIQMEKSKAQIKAALGKDLYDKVYKFIRAEREKQTPENKIMKKLHHMIPKENKILSKWFELDQLIYMEIVRGW